MNYSRFIGSFRVVMQRDRVFLVVCLTLFLWTLNTVVKCDNLGDNLNDNFNGNIDYDFMYDFNDEDDTNLTYDSDTSPKKNVTERTRVSVAEKFMKTLLLPVKLVNFTSKLVKGTVAKLPWFSKQQRPRKEKNANILNKIAGKFKAIFPGTRWCGDGNVAKNNEDLGYFNKTDACCRDHDNCADILSAEETKGGLVNNGLFTRSHCTCDDAFYKCLKNAQSFVATQIGFTYFNILCPQCFKEDYPIIGCNVYRGLNPLRRKCSDYVQDYTKEKKVQWFDNLNFV